MMICGDRGEECGWGWGWGAGRVLLVRGDVGGGGGLALP